MKAVSSFLASIIVASMAAVLVALADGPTWAWVATFLIVHLCSPHSPTDRRVA